MKDFQSVPAVALLGPVPVDIGATLLADFMLLEEHVWSAMSLDARLQIDRALTSATSGVRLDQLERLPGLRRIISIGAGKELFDVTSLGERGIELCTTPEVMTEDTAEAAVALVFAALRNIVSNDRFVRRGLWGRKRVPLGTRLSSARAGIVGLGRIGHAIATKLTALGCHVKYNGRSPKDVPWDFEPDLKRLAEAVDVLILSCPDNESTRGLIDAQVLKRLGPGGYLVNVARASVVDEEALIKALKERRLAGAALDVFENEPNLDPRFATLDNCVLQPHSAVYTTHNRVNLTARLRQLLLRDD